MDSGWYFAEQIGGLEPNCQLPAQKATTAEARITLIRRRLKNTRVNVWALYRPILEQALRDWQNEEAIVILDGVSVFGDRLQIFRLSLEHGCCAIPPGWVVLEGKGLTQVERLQEMLEQVAAFLKEHVKSVLFLADRGFRDCDWVNLCLKLGWSYGIRLSGKQYLCDPGRRPPVIHQRVRCPAKHKRLLSRCSGHARRETEKQLVGYVDKRKPWQED